jgi:hypothetical protein
MFRFGLRLASALTLGAAALALPHTAFADSSSPASVFQFSGDSAIAQFQSFDPNNSCAETDAYIVAGDMTDKSMANSGSQWALIFVEQTADCWNTVSGLVYKGSLPAGALQIDRTLSSGSLNASLMGQDLQANPEPVSISMTWAGSGALSRQTMESQFHSPGFTAVSRYSSLSRQATASGTVSGGTASFVLSTDNANLNHQTQGSVTVCNSSSFCK